MHTLKIIDNSSMDRSTIDSDPSPHNICSKGRIVDNSKRTWTWAMLRHKTARGMKRSPYNIVGSIEDNIGIGLSPYKWTIPVAP